MINLISNAIKFSDSNSKVEISIDYTEDGLDIKVADEGIGIKKEDIPNLFNKFYQIDSSLARNAEGAGLGLWLTNQLIEAHQATIRIDSEYGEGTVVTVSFPKERMVFLKT